MAFMAAAAPIIGLVGSVASTGFGFLGAMQQGEAASNAAKYQAQVQRNNEIIARNNAQYQTQAGAARAQANDLKNRAMLGSLEAAQGASGIDFDSDTSEDIRTGARQIARLDTQTLYNNALLQANASLSQASNFSAQAGLSDFEARNASSSALMKGFGSLLGGASSFADKWSRYQNVGVQGFGSIF